MRNLRCWFRGLGARYNGVSGLGLCIETMCLLLSVKDADGFDYSLMDTGLTVLNVRFTEVRDTLPGLTMDDVNACRPRCFAGRAYRDGCEARAAVQRRGIWPGGNKTR